MEFLAWSLNDRGSTPQWVAKQKSALAAWMEKFHGVNLRRVTLRDHISPVLERASDKATRVRVIKSFYGWLRKEPHLLSYAEDPTLDLRLRAVLIDALVRGLDLVGPEVAREVWPLLAEGEADDTLARWWVMLGCRPGEATGTEVRRRFNTCEWYPSHHRPSCA